MLKIAIVEDEEINIKQLKEYLEQFREASRPLPKHTCNIRKGENDNE